MVVHAAFGSLDALVAHMAKDVPVAGFCSTSACLRRSSMIAERGFSFQNDGPLDMRMDPTSGASAADWLAEAEADEIRDVIGTLGEERFAGRIARAIVEARA